MIRRADLQERVREWGLQEHVLEKDYVIGWLLWALGQEPSVLQGWAFKGGTCLKKCYLDTYRFSEDLDFTILEGGTLHVDLVRPLLERVQERVTRESGIEFPAPLVLKTLSPRSVEGRLYYRGPVGSRNPGKVKLDLTAAERVVRPTVLRPITHDYPDTLPEVAKVGCYSYEEVFAEKIRALAERCRPRDLYDVVNIFRRGDPGTAPDLVRQVLDEKCRFKGIPTPTMQSMAASPFRVELETEWENMLAHQIPLLPEIGPFWEDLEGLFGWLEGRPIAELPEVPGADGVVWSPPSTGRLWGQMVPLEPIRFAAANRLCVELGYQGRIQTMEPYALRRSREGVLLLYAVEATTGEMCAYPVDQIQSARVSNRVFHPRFRVELVQSGLRPLAPSPAPPEPLVSTGSGSRVVECPQCGRRFTRFTTSTALRPHQAPGGFACPGRVGLRAD